ncbi:hypothetical protein QW180_20870 [Vibrio sinaloensis]|nr:hypothetical protein [Vibrio sinaloensis]
MNFFQSVKKWICRVFQEGEKVRFLVKKQGSEYQLVQLEAVEG